MKKLAICIPTYNRKEVVEDILEKINFVFGKQELDIYIFDSSEEEITYEYSKDESSVSVFYRKIDSSIHSNAKVFLIYSNKEIIEVYEYIWILPDYMFYSNGVIQDLKNAMAKSEDCILINYWNNEKVDNHNCSDINYLFEKYAALLTQFGTIVVKSDIFSKRIDLKIIKEKYLQEDRINFSHVGLYFEIMAMCDNLRIEVIECEKKDYYKSSAKKIYISKDNLAQKKENKNWETAFHVWAVCWPQTVMALPDVYKNKWDVVYSEVVRADILNERFLISQRSIGATKLSIVLKNFFKWKYMSTTPILKSIFVCLMPQRYAAWCTFNRSVMWKKRVSNNLKKIKKLSLNNSIYVYGAGKVADEYIKVLEDNDITIRSIVVTDPSLFSKSAYGHKVIGIEELKNNNNDYIIILALNKDNKKVVTELLKEYGMEKKIFDKKINVW